jgi:hypothetical protein
MRIKLVNNLLNHIILMEIHLRVLINSFYKKNFWKHDYIE